MAQHAVMTGPIKKTFTLSTGAEVDTRPDIVMVDTPEEAAELADLIGKYHADPNTPCHPDHDDEHPFNYQSPES